MDDGEQTGAPALAVVTTTVEHAEQAEALAQALLAERLAACVQITAIRSVYRWEGAVQRTGEQRLDAKTCAERVPELVARLRALHPYTLPEILVTPAAAAFADYAQWVRREASPGPAV